MRRRRSWERIISPGTKRKTERRNETRDIPCTNVSAFRDRDSRALKQSEREKRAFEPRKRIVGMRRINEYKRMESGEDAREKRDTEREREEEAGRDIKLP